MKSLGKAASTNISVRTIEPSVSLSDAASTLLPQVQDLAFKLEQPRIVPLSEAEWAPEVSQTLNNLRQGGEVFNILTTIAQHPDLLKSWLGFGQHILGTSTLPARDRELIILRMGWLNRSRYEWGHHVPIGKAVGLTDADIQRIAQGPDSPGLAPLERVLLTAMDELNRDSFIQTDTWRQLAEHYSAKQLLDILFTAGQYRMVSMVLNSVGVQLEEGF